MELAARSLADQDTDQLVHAFFISAGRHDRNRLLLPAYDEMRRTLLPYREECFKTYYFLRLVLSGLSDIYKS